MILIVTFAQKGNSFGGIDVPKLPGLRVDLVEVVLM